MRLWLLLCLVACGHEVVEPSGPSHPLDSKVYRFCHEPGLDGAEAQAWCPLLDAAEPDEVCPGLRETCSGAEFVSSSGCSQRTEGSGGATSGSPSGMPDWQPASCEAPTNADAWMLLMRWVMALVVALVLMGLLRLLYRYWGTNQLRVESSLLVPVDILEEELPDVPAWPSGDLLDAARSALAAGELGLAVVMARGAALRFLGDEGRLSLHRAKTDREYGRAVRRDPAHGDLLAVLRATEVHRWGGRPVEEDTARSALRAAERILKPVLLLLCLLGAPKAQAQDDRHGPNGDAALLEVLRSWGHNVSWRSGGLADLDHSTDVLVLDSTWVVPDEEEWLAIEEWVGAGGVLWVTGDAPFEELGERVWLEPSMPVIGSELLSERAVAPPRWPEGARWAYDGALGVYWVETLPESGPFLEEPQESLPVVLSIDVGDGAVVAISDNRLLWNGAFVWVDNGRFVGEIVHIGQAALGWPVGVPARIELATSAAPESPPPPQAVRNAHLLPFVLHLMGIWLLVGLWRGMPFAPLRDPAVEGRLDFVAHVRALGTRWYRLGASRYALAAYAALWSGRLGVAGLRLAATRYGRSPEQVQDLIDALNDAQSNPDGPSDASDLEWMEELWRITQTR